jgi:cell division protein FtsL
MPRPRQILTSQTVHTGKIRRATGQHLHVLLCSAVTVLSGVLLYIWPQVRLVEMGYQHNALRARRGQALQRQKELRVELATLQQLPRIEGIALQRIGLRPPQGSQVIYVQPGQHTPASRREP